MAFAADGRWSTSPRRHQGRPCSRTAFLAEHPDTAAELRAKETKRRERKASKSGDDAQRDIFDADSDPDASDDASEPED